MTKSKTTHVLCLLNQCLLSFVIVTFFLIIFHDMNGWLGEYTMTSILLAGSLVIPTAAISYYIHVNVNNVFLYAMGHLIPAVGLYLLLPNAISFTIIIVLAFLMVVHLADNVFLRRAIIAREEHSDDARLALPTSILAPHPAQLIVFIIFYIINMVSAKSRSIDVLLFYGCGIGVILFCLYKYRSSMDKFFITNKAEGVYTLPAKQIMDSGRLLIIIFTVITSALILLVPLNGLNSLSAMLANAFLALIRMMVPDTPASGNLPNDAPNTDPLEHMPEEFAEVIGTEGEMPIWLGRLVYGISTAIVILLLLAVLFLILRAIYVFIRSYSGIKVMEAPNAEYIETSQSVLPKKKLKKVTDEFSSPSGIVRKLYRYTIRSHRKSKNIAIPTSCTPTEVEQIVNLSQEDTEILYLHNMYEKARYSKDGVSMAEAEDVKMRSRNIK